eukprot:gene33462-44812_t
MKIVKTSAIALTLSAMLASPVLAQGAASGTQTGGSMQQGGAMQRGGAAGGADTELNAKTPGAKMGAGASAGTTDNKDGSHRSRLAHDMTDAARTTSDRAVSKLSAVAHFQLLHQGTLRRTDRAAEAARAVGATDTMILDAFVLAKAGETTWTCAARPSTPRAATARPTAIPTRSGTAA